MAMRKPASGQTDFEWKMMTVLGQPLLGFSIKYNQTTIYMLSFCSSQSAQWRFLCFVSVSFSLFVSSAVAECFVSLSSPLFLSSTNKVS
jgi:hypothetical protein